MTRATRIAALVCCSFVLLLSNAHAAVLADYTYSAASLNPTTQGWSWNSAGSVVDGGTNLLMIEAVGSPNFLFTDSVPSNAFLAPWEMSGTMRFGGNAQTTLGLVLFADDGTNFWHMSFRNSGNPFDGIYMGDLGALVYTEHPGSSGPGPFDDFRRWSLVDVDGAGGAAPGVYLDGVSLGIPAVSLPSKFAAGTVGFGSLNDTESGFFQTNRVFFDGDPNAVPEPFAGALALMAACTVMPLVRGRRRR